MSNKTLPVASRTKRFFAFAIDQTILMIVGLIIILAVFATQSQQLNTASNAFFGDPVWSQIDKLSSEEVNARIEDLMASSKVVNSVEALAHPFAVVLCLTLVLSAIYYLIPTVRWGATLGKYWLKIKVQNLDGTLPDLWQSSARYFALVGLGTFSSVVTILDLFVNKAFLASNTAVDILTILLSQATWILSVVSIVMIISRVDRRGLHDILAKTIVLEAPSKSKKQ